MSFKVNFIGNSSNAYAFNQMGEMQQVGSPEHNPEADTEEFMDTEVTVNQVSAQPQDTTEETEELQRKRKVARELLPTEASTRRDVVKSALDEMEATIVVKSDEQREQENVRMLNARYLSQFTKLTKV